MRGTDYKKEYNKQAFKLCLLGATDADLANFFDVTETTINNWKIKFPSFFESIKKGKAEADATIAESLYHRAKGYEHDDEEIKVVPVGNNQGSEVVRVKIRKKYPPDPTSMIFWLKNRDKKNWRDKVETDIDLTVKSDLTGIPEDELKQIENIFLRYKKIG